MVVWLPVKKRGKKCLNNTFDFSNFMANLYVYSYFFLFCCQQWKTKDGMSKCIIYCRLWEWICKYTMDRNCILCTVLSWMIKTTTSLTILGLSPLLNTLPTYTVHIFYPNISDLLDNLNTIAVYSLYVTMHSTLFCM